MSKKGGGSAPQPIGNTQSSVSSDSAPWSGVQPWLLNGGAVDTGNLPGYNGIVSGSVPGAIPAAAAIYKTGGPAYYPGQTLASTSPYTMQGINGLASAAQGNQGIQNAAGNLTTSTLNGDFLNSNPYVDQTYSHAADQLEGRMRSAFGGSDVNPNTNSSLQAATAQGLSDLGNQVYGGNYQAERARQDQALALAPQTQQAAFTNPSQLINAGETAQGLSQQSINDQINRYNYNQNLPYLNLQNYMGMLSGNFGQSQTQTQTNPIYGPSGGQSAFGGALGGAAGGAMMGIPGGPPGIALGALAGGLLGGIR